MIVRLKRSWAPVRRGALGSANGGGASHIIRITGVLNNPPATCASAPVVASAAIQAKGLQSADGGRGRAGVASPFQAAAVAASTLNLHTEVAGAPKC